MTDKREIIVHGVDVSEWTDEEVRYKLEKHSPKAIRQIAFDLYKQLKRKERECEELKEKLIRISGEYKDTLSIVEDMAIFLGLERIDHFNIYQCYYKLKEMLNEYRQELKPFKDDYFKNLDTKTIAELAKKSIRLTTENRKLEDALDELEDIADNYNRVEKTSQYYRDGFDEILNITNKAKGGVNGNT